MHVPILLPFCFYFYYPGRSYSEELMKCVIYETLLKKDI